MKRRQFLKQLGLAAAGTMLMPEWVQAGRQEQLTILFTNDWHSRIEPFPMDGGRNQGLGGASKRAALIRSIRQEGNQVVLLDAGDIFQGTPYFNIYKGEIEFKLMSSMGYDAATMGNHDFDAGLEGFKRQLPHANFPFVVSNYDVSDTILKNDIRKYLILKKGIWKIGVIGLGIELQGLVPEALYGKVKYQDPVSKANEMAAFLKKEKRCDLVICLSHLGYQYKSEKISDVKLAKQSDNIDIILGGHTHTFLRQPDKIINISGQTTWVCQTGWGGINLGRIDFKSDRKNSAENTRFSMLEIC